jgi:hypothetical protein
VPDNGRWTRNRQELLEWLSKTSPSLAELYQGAGDILFGRPVAAPAAFQRFGSCILRVCGNFRSSSPLPRNISAFRRR